MLSYAGYILDEGLQEDDYSNPVHLYASTLIKIVYVNNM
jgi:ABC-type dipeptide/oligopeptide/nickel transport system ATPase component